MRSCASCRFIPTTLGIRPDPPDFAAVVVVVAFTVVVVVAAVVDVVDESCAFIVVVVDFTTVVATDSEFELLLVFVELFGAIAEMIPKITIKPMMTPVIIHFVLLDHCLLIHVKINPSGQQQINAMITTATASYHFGTSLDAGGAGGPGGAGGGGELGASDPSPIGASLIIFLPLQPSSA